MSEVSLIIVIEQCNFILQKKTTIANFIYFFQYEGESGWIIIIIIIIKIISITLVIISQISLIWKLEDHNKNEQK